MLRPDSFAEAARPAHQAQIGADREEWKARRPVAAHPRALRLSRRSGVRPVAGLSQADMLRVLSPIWTEIPETARRVRQRLRTVMDWCRTAGHFDGDNPVDGVEAGLARRRPRRRISPPCPTPSCRRSGRGSSRLRGLGALALRFAILDRRAVRRGPRRDLGGGRPRGGALDDPGRPDEGAAGSIAFRCRRRRSRSSASSDRSPPPLRRQYRWSSSPPSAACSQRRTRWRRC